MKQFFGLLVVVIVVTSIRVGHWYRSDQAIWQAGQRLRVRMVLEQEIEINNKLSIFKYQNHELTCLIKAPECKGLNSLNLGDRVTVEGEVIENYLNKVELRIDKVEQIELAGKWSYWQVVRKINQLGSRLEKGYQLTLSEPHASLLSGIVLGQRERMPTRFYDALVETGTVHVVAASGFNVTIVAKVIMGILLLVLSRRMAIIVAIMGVGAYVLLAGAGPPVVRAGLMGSLVFIAQALGRDYWAGWGLALSVFLMLWLWPWLIVSVSFQLSVMATGGILVLSKPISKRLTNKKTENTWLNSFRTDLTTTLAAGLATAPVIWITFGRVAWISPLVNMLVLWLVAPLMALGAVVAGLSLVSMPFAQVGAWLTWPLLNLFILLVEGFSLWVT